MGSIEKFLLQFLLIPIFFPYVGFIEGIDLQPFYFIGLLILTLINISSSKKIFIENEKITIAVIFTLIVGFLRFLFDYLFQDYESNFIVFMFHMLTIILILFNSRILLKLVTKELILVVSFVYVLVGFIQITFDETFLSFMVYRGYQDLLSTSRGVRSLCSEPSTFSYTLILLNCIYILIIYDIKRSNTKIIRSSIPFVIFNLIFSQSFFGFFIHALPLILFFFKGKILKFLSTAIISLYSLKAILPVLLSYYSNRFFYILNASVNNPILLLEEGAMKKVLNLPLSIEGGLKNKFLGLGFDSSTTNNFTYLKGLLVIDITNKNMGGLIEIFMQLGILSLPFFIVLLSKIYMSNDFTYPIFVFTFSVLIYNSYGHPLNWVLIIFILSLKKIR